MRKNVRYILCVICVLITSFTFISCESDVDGLPPGRWYFMIVNDTDHNVLITVDRGENINRLQEDFFIAPRDSIVKDGECGGWVYVPFDTWDVTLIFDDSIFCYCGPLLEEERRRDGIMFYNEMNYERLIDSDEINLYRYRITEEDYEYAVSQSANKESPINSEF